MTFPQFFDALLGPRPWCKDRRRFWPRALKWILAFLCWVPVGMLWVFMQQS